MEKLLKLLNKYRTEKGERNLNEFEVSQTLDSLNYLRLFIKWLVDNDKIDLEKLDEKAERKPQYTFIDDDWRLWFKLFEVYESLLMLLAIQENHIEFLCSVLI